MSEHPEGNKWISVEERLPEEGQEVLFSNDLEKFVHFGTFTRSSRSDMPEFYWQIYPTGEPFLSKEITHWQPLPPAPSEEE